MKIVLNIWNLGLNIRVRNCVAVVVCHNVAAFHHGSDNTVRAIDIQHWLHFFAIEFAQFCCASTHFRVVFTAHGTYLSFYYKF